MSRLSIVVAAMLLGAAGCGSEETPSPAGQGGTGGTGGTGGVGGEGGSGAPEAKLAFIDIYPGVDLTADGSKAVFMDFATPTNEISFYDVATGTLEKKTETGSYERPLFAMSADGSRIIGSHGDPEEAGIWSEATGWMELGSTYTVGCDGRLSGGWDLNADGSVAIGMLWNGCDVQAFRWTDASGQGVFTPLQVLGTGNNRASVISDDGSTIAGFAMSGPLVDRTPTIWNADGTGFMLDESGEAVGEVLSISSDGKMVAGIWNLDGFVWTAETGVVNIGKLPNSMPTDSTWPNAIAAGGKLVFGASGDPWGSGAHAFVWTAEGGMRALQPIAEEQGLTIREGFELSGVVAASDDGSVLLGIATNPNTLESISFVLRMPTSVYGI